MIVPRAGDILSEKAQKSHRKKPLWSQVLMDYALFLEMPPKGQRRERSHIGKERSCGSRACTNVGQTRVARSVLGVSLDNRLKIIVEG